MGLTVSHGCWDGAYSAFHRWRTAVASTIGMDLEKMEGFGGTVLWSSLPSDPLHKLLHHSDCEGQIDAEDCAPIAERLEAILPALATYDAVSTPGGHLARQGMAGATAEFAGGLRLAASLGENVEFH
jgi:hypothetical protein